MKTDLYTTGLRKGEIDKEIFDRLPKLCKNWLEFKDFIYERKKSGGEDAKIHQTIKNVD